MKITMRLEEISAEFLLVELPTDTIKQLQECLVAGEYLLNEQVTGNPDSWTLDAFAAFKRDSWMGRPEVIGGGSAQAVLDLQNKRAGTDEATQIPHTVLADIGKPTGKIMLLPGREQVHENQCIVPGIPLTWGEITAGCTRVPLTLEHVSNAIELAKTFGWVRDRFGSPILITSGYRPPAVNRAVGGSSKSQHIDLRALDMHPLNGQFDLLWKCLRNSPFTGLGNGKHKGFYHGDIRPGRRIIFGY